MYNDSVFQVSYLIIYTFTHVCVYIHMYVYISHTPVKYTSFSYQKFAEEVN